jgi:hypothetical protein
MISHVLPEAVAPKILASRGPYQKLSRFPTGYGAPKLSVANSRFVVRADEKLPALWNSNQGFAQAAILIDKQARFFQNSTPSGKRI